jgi:hypothetical protein
LKLKIIKKNKITQNNNIKNLNKDKDRFVTIVQEKLFSRKSNINN